jgi:CRP-like cAMP-binding protein
MHACRFLPAGLEAFFAGEIQPNMYIVLSGSLRVMLEPSNATYCRAVDLTAGDTFAEAAVTRPGAPMSVQPLSMQDTHLVVLSKHSVQEVSIWCLYVCCMDGYVVVVCIYIYIYTYMHIHTRRF